MTTLPEEAVKAAIDTWQDHEFDGTLDYPRMRNALTAALPFLSALEPSVARKELMKQIREGTAYGFLNDGSQPEGNPDLDCPYCCGSGHKGDVRPSAARELALEEGFRKGLEAACEVIDAHSEYDRRLCCDGRECGCYGATVHQSMHHYIRALSSPDHADAGKVEGDGWLPIESAPKDGTEVIYLTKYGSIGFCRYAVDDINDWFGWWDLQADDEVYPKRWLPRSALPSAPSQEVA